MYLVFVFVCCFLNVFGFSRKLNHLASSGTTADSLTMDDRQSANPAVDAFSSALHILDETTNGHVWLQYLNDRASALETFIGFANETVRAMEEHILNLYAKKISQMQSQKDLSVAAVISKMQEFQRYMTNTFSESDTNSPFVNFFNSELSLERGIVSTLLNVKGFITYTIEKNGLTSSKQFSDLPGSLGALGTGNFDRLMELQRPFANRITADMDAVLVINMLNSARQTLINARQASTVDNTNVLSSALVSSKVQAILGAFSNVQNILMNRSNHLDSDQCQEYFDKIHGDAVSAQGLLMATQKNAFERVIDKVTSFVSTASEYLNDAMTLQS